MEGFFRTALADWLRIGIGSLTFILVLKALAAGRGYGFISKAAEAV